MSENDTLESDTEYHDTMQTKLTAFLKQISGDDMSVLASPFFWIHFPNSFVHMAWFILFPMHDNEVVLSEIIDFIHLIVDGGLGSLYCR